MPNYYNDTMTNLDGFNAITGASRVKNVGGAFKGPNGGTASADMDLIGIANISGVYGTPPGITNALITSTGDVGSSLITSIGSSIGDPDTVSMLNNINMKAITDSTDLHELLYKREPISTGLIRDSYGIWRDSTGAAVTLTSVSGSIEIVGGGGDTSTPTPRSSGTFNVRIGASSPRQPIEKRYQ